MALTIQYTKKFQKVVWKSGHFYKFKYQAWESDPEPVILLMYAYSGRHPNTGHSWLFFQAINFTYIPRTHRKFFVERWMVYWEQSNGNFQLTWGRVLSEFPFVKNAVRRYFYSPAYYIQNPMEIPMEDIENVVVSTWSKDFSKKLRTSVVQKIKKARKNVSKGLISGVFKR